MTSITAFPDSEQKLKYSLKNAAVDAASFSRPLRRCPKGGCLGMCCYDGAYLPQDQELVITRIANEEKQFFCSLGLSLPDPVMVFGKWRDRSGSKIAVKPRPFSKLVPAYPKDFLDTACVFLTEQGLCSLQLLSEHHQKHPWYYKPHVCSLFPVHTGQGRIWLPNSQTDPLKYPDYNGFVSQIFCGRDYAEGVPAWQLLDDELRFLSQMIERDLISEIKAGLPKQGDNT